MGLGGLAVGLIIGVLEMSAEKENKINKRKDEEYGVGTGC